MEKKALKITVLLLLSFLSSTQQMSCQEDNIWWKFELHTDRSVHVEAVVTLMESTGSYTFLEVPKFLEVPDEIWIKNVRAYEYESRLPIEHEVREQTITLNFSQPTPEPFTFGIEFDLADFMEERKEKVFIFKWWYNPDKEESCTGVILLPEGAELLDLQYIEPARVEEGAQVTIYYEGKLGYYNDFRVQLTFSPSGKDYVGLAERYEEAGDYDSALSYYQKAKSLYSRYNYYEETNPEFLEGLCERIFTIQKIHADNTFEEATEAFEKEEYEEAKTQFRKAESLYRALKDTEKESQCKEMFLKCQAEMLLEQGKTQYKAFKYPSAKKSFIQAKNEFEELGNTEKVSECEEWLDKIEEVYRIILLCIFGAVAIFLAWWQRFH